MWTRNLIHFSFKPKEVSSNGDDLALIRLPTLAVTIDEDPDENVAPVCLAWNEKAKLPTKQHVVMGWGRYFKVLVVKIIARS